MAAHFDYLCEAEFPSAQLADHVAKQSIESTDLQNRKNAVIAAKYVFLFNFTLLHVSVRLGPLNGNLAVALIQFSTGTPFSPFDPATCERLISKSELSITGEEAGFGKLI